METTMPKFSHIFTIVERVRPSVALTLAGCRGVACLYGPSSKHTAPEHTCPQKKMMKPLSGDLDNVCKIGKGHLPV